LSNPEDAHPIEHVDYKNEDNSSSECESESWKPEPDSVPENGDEQEAWDEARGTRGETPDEWGFGELEDLNDQAPEDGPEAKDWKVVLNDLDIEEGIMSEFPHPVLIEGPVGTGKSTLLKKIAEKLNIKYYSETLVDTTTAGDFKGYKSVFDGAYFGPEFREAVEFGGMFVLEELNAATSNMPIIFNQLENGSFSFADKTIKKHKDFFLCATMNDASNRHDFAGRRSVDRSVLDRFRLFRLLAPIFKTSELSMKISEEIVSSLESSSVLISITARDRIRFDRQVSKSKESNIVDIAFNILYHTKTQHQIPDGLLGRIGNLIEKNKGLI